jgi:hypothetical protein
MIDMVVGTLIKRIILIFGLAIVFTISETRAQQFGITAGVSLTDNYLKYDGYDYSSHTRTNLGGMMGLLYDYKIDRDITIESGLLFSSKGYRLHFKQTTNGELLMNRGRLILFYTEVPLLIKFFQDFGNVRIYGRVGPVVGFGLFGHRKFELEIAGEYENIDRSVRWGSGASSDFRRIDGGFIGSTGVRLKSDLDLDISYNIGLADIADIGVVKNRALTLHLTKWFR